MTEPPLTLRVRLGRFTRDVHCFIAGHAWAPACHKLPQRTHACRYCARCGIYQHGAAEATG